MSYFDKWKKKQKDGKYPKQDKQYSQDMFNNGESNLPAVIPSKDAQATIRYVDQQGDVYDNDYYADYTPYRSNKIGFGRHQNSWGGSSDYNQYGYNYDYSNYRKSYSGISDDDNEIIKGNIAFFDKSDSNQYVQRRINEWLEEMNFPQWKKLQEVLKKHNKNPDVVQKAAPYLRNTSKYVDYDQNSEMFIEPVVRNFIVNDLYAMYFLNEYEIKKLNTKAKHEWFTMLSGLNNYLLKIITNDNSVYSGIVVYHIIKNLLMSDENRQKVCKDSKSCKELDQFMQEIKDGTFSPVDCNDKTQKDLKEYQNAMSQSLSDILNNAMKETSDELANREKLDQMFGKKAGLGTEKDRESLKKMLDMNRIDAKLISKFIHGVIRNTKHAAGGAKPQYKEESFLDADEIEDILDLELVPFGALIDDMHVHDIEYKQKFDVYVDLSGSMSSHIWLKADDDSKILSGQSKMNQDCQVSIIALAKLIYYKMYTMNIIHDIYGFEDLPYKLTHEEFMCSAPSGGTKIEAVIQQVEKQTKTPSLIVTDLCDSIHTHSKNIFILGIEGTINNHKDKAFQTFIANKQVKILKNGYVRDYYDAFPEKRPTIKSL